jgi:hypothetical protein
MNVNMNGRLTVCASQKPPRRNIAWREALPTQGANNLPCEVSAMTRTMTALAAAATMAVAAVAVPQQAEARWGHGHGWGGGAFVGGLAAGAIVGGALAGPGYYGYYGGPYGYYGDAYAYGGQCWRERIATPYGWRWRRVCE